MKSLKKGQIYQFYQNDTNNTIEFNDSFNKEIKEDETRSFWIYKFK